MARTVALLDRDGTLNVDNGYVYRSQDFHWIPDAVAALKRLSDAGIAIAVVTNQSGIARGMYTAVDVEKLHQYMRDQLALQQVSLDAVAYCPHSADDDCACRKPCTAMAAQIEDQIGEEIDYPSSWMIGDKPSDVEFGIRLGVRTALIRSRYWNPSDLHVKPDFQIDSLSKAVEIVLDSRQA
jgi:D-glycero-D-manno-heptose 1,7-bisphosphate phosphatase